jgi:hypothetical protein
MKPPLSARSAKHSQLGLRADRSGEDCVSASRTGRMGPSRRKRPANRESEPIPFCGAAEAVIDLAHGGRRNHSARLSASRSLALWAVCPFAPGLLTPVHREHTPHYLHSFQSFPHSIRHHEERGCTALVRGHLKERFGATSVSSLWLCVSVALFPSCLSRYHSRNSTRRSACPAPVPAPYFSHACPR